MNVFGDGDCDIPVFSVNVGHQIEPGLLAVGLFDGSPSLAVVSQRRVLIKAPVCCPEDDVPETRILNIQREITALATGRFAKKVRKRTVGIADISGQTPEILFIASPESIRATDIYSNADLYVSDTSDEGALSLTFGAYECFPKLPDTASSPSTKIPSYTHAASAAHSAGAGGKHQGKVFRGVTIVGGRASVRVLDTDGTELMWASAPAEVTAVGLTPFVPPSGSVLTSPTDSGAGEDSRHPNAIVAGCSDGSLVWYRGSLSYATVHVGGPVSALATVAQGAWGLRQVAGIGELVAFRTLTGTVGVATAGGVVWSRRTTGHGEATGGVLMVRDLDADGEAEVVVDGPRGVMGLAVSSGHERWHVGLGGREPIAVASGNIAQRQADQLVVAFRDGSVEGYEIATPDDGVVGPHAFDTQRAEAELAAVLSAHAAASQQVSRLSELFEQRMRTPAAMRVPVDVAVSVAADGVGQGLSIVATANNGFVHHLIVTGAGQGAQGGDTLSATAKGNVAKDTLSVAITPSRDAAASVLVRVFVSSDSSSPASLVAVDVSIDLPPFPGLVPRPFEAVPRPSGHVTFRFTDRPKRLLQWLQRSFPQHSVPLAVTAEGEVHAAYDDAASHGGVVVSMVRDTITVGAESIELAGRIVQHFASFFNVTSLTSTCSFPADFEMLATTCTAVAELNATRLRLTAQTASEADNVKVLVVFAEDARLMRDAQTVRRNLVALSNVNQDLILSHRTRAANHAELLANLKRMNSYVQLGAALRVGQPAHEMVQACRAAIKDNRTNVLAQIISSGRES